MKLVCTATIILTEKEVASLYEAKTTLEKLAADMRLQNVAEVGTVDPTSLEFAFETIEDVLDTCHVSEEF